MKVSKIPRNEILFNNTRKCCPKYAKTSAWRVITDDTNITITILYYKYTEFPILFDITHTTKIQTNQYQYSLNLCINYYV